MISIAAQAADHRAANREYVVLAVLRQHRNALTGLTIVFAAFAIPLVVTGILARAGHLGADSWIESKYAGVNILPFLAGTFLGAPLVASDFETGAFRFTMTQGLSFRRQVAVKLLVIGGVLAVAAALLGGLSMWALAPNVHVAPRSYTALSHWSPAYFNISALMLPAWALLGFGIGVLAGAVIRRAGAAIAVTIVAVGIVTGVMSSYAARTPGGLYHETLTVNLVAVRDDAAPFGRITWSSDWPRHVTAKLYRMPGPPGSYMVATWLAGPHGRLTPREDRQLNNIPYAVLRNVTKSWAWVTRRHITAWFGYQPASRYWLFQSAYTAILLTFAAAAGCTAVWVAGRRR